MQSCFLFIYLLLFFKKKNVNLFITLISNVGPTNIFSKKKKKKNERQIGRISIIPSF